MKWIEFESKFSMKLSSCWPIRSVTICLNMPGTESQDGRWTSTSKHLLAASVTHLLAARTAARAHSAFFGVISKDGVATG